MYNARTPQTQYRSRRKKRVAFERFSFPWSTSITSLVNIKRISYPRLCDCSRGLFVGFKGVQNHSNNISRLHILMSLDHQCQVLQLVNISHFPLFPPGRNYSPNIFEVKDKKHSVTALPSFLVKCVSVWSCLPLQSSPRLVSATWRKTVYNIRWVP